MKLILLIMPLVVSIVAVRSGTKEALDAKVGDFPYITLIEVRHPHTGRFMPICAGAIISQYDVLTNALCASSCQHPPNCRIYAGRVNIDAGGIELEIVKTKWHKNFNEMHMVQGETYLEAKENPVVDFGIIHTKKIPFSDAINVIALADRDGINNETVKIAGWGGENNEAFKDEPKQQDILKYGYTKTKLCKTPNDVPAICVLKDEEVRPCISDMGASMIYPDSNQLAGLGTIWHLQSCGNKSFQQVFPQVDWIKENMCDDCSDD